MMKTALTIAGSDSGGGAGIQADLKTFCALGVYGMSAITAITAQNTCGVTAIRELDTEIIAAQIEAVYQDIPVDAVKIGMLSNDGIIQEVARQLKKHGENKIVLDTVMVSKSGSHLLKQEAVTALKQFLLPMALVVTPNLLEASVLVGFEVQDRQTMERAAREIYHMGARYVVIKGGHLEKAPCDLLYDGQELLLFEGKRIDTKHTHGTGCTFSSAIAAALAKGQDVKAAVQTAKDFVTMAIRHGFALGKGVGPTHHLYDLYAKAHFI